MASPTELNQLYLAYFGRPADAGGLAFYANSPVAQVIAGFSASPESQALYGNTFGAAQISQIYTALFNRPAEPAGIAVWTALLANGGVSSAALALTILQSAGNDDQLTVANKLAFTTQWTSTLEPQAEKAGLSVANGFALAKTLLALVGSTQASLASALAGGPTAIAAATAPAGASAPAPQTFTLTTAADTIAGGAGDDTITGFAVNNGGTESASATFNAALDTINGGAGTDTLALTTSGTTPGITIDPVRVTNVERLQVTATTNNTTITLDPTSSFTEIVSNGTVNNTSITGFGASVTRLGVSNLATGTATLRAAAGTLAGTSDVLTLTLSNDGSTSNGIVTPATIKLDPATGTDFYETLNVVTTGTANYATLSTGTAQTALTTVNISGSAPLNLAFGNGDKARLATTFDASATTGGITLGGTTSATTLGAAAQTVKLGSGNDTVFFGANLDTNDTVDGGAGRDSLGIGGANGVSSGDLTHVSNFEVLLLAPVTSTLVQDVAQLAGKGFSAIGFAQGIGTASITLQNMPSDNSLPLELTSSLGNYTIAAQLATPGGSADAITLRMAYPTAISGGANIGILSDITGLETLNIVSGGSGTANSINDDRILAKHVITGSVALSVAANSAAGNIVVDASAFTGKLDFSASSDTTTGYGVTALLGTGGGSVTGGYGTNLITLGAQGSNAASYELVNLRGTAVSNTVRLVGNTTTGNGAATGYLSTDLQAADFRDGSSNVNNITLQLSANDNDFALKNFAGTLSTGLARGTVAKGLGVGDTLVTQDVALNDAATGGTTNVTHIALTTATAFTTDIKSTFAAAMGSASITGLAADANYLVSLFDPTTLNHRTLYAIVNTGASGAGDTTLSAADFTNGGIAVIGVVLDGSLGAGISFGTAF
ncbi:MAG: DUF4214 domain-containing protein [Pseudomonadota bacterium]